MPTNGNIVNNRTTRIRRTLGLAIAAVVLASGFALPASPAAAEPEPTTEAPVFVNKHGFNATVKEAYRGYFDVTGSPRPVVTVTGVPFPITIEKDVDDTFVFLGTPKKAGDFQITITATNSAGTSKLTATLHVRGYGQHQESIGFYRGGVGLDDNDKKSLRSFVNSLRPQTTFTTYEITGTMHYTGHWAKDKKKAKARAWAIASYLRKKGITAKPRYTYNVESHDGDLTYSRLNVEYSYRG